MIEKGDNRSKALWGGILGHNTLNERVSGPKALGPFLGQDTPNVSESRVFVSEGRKKYILFSFKGSPYTFISGIYHGTMDHGTISYGTGTMVPRK